MPACWYNAGKTITSEFNPCLESLNGKWAKLWISYDVKIPSMIWKTENSSGVMRT